MNWLKLVIILGMAGVYGCGKDGDDDDPQMPETGQVMGNLRLADEFGNLRLTHESVKVSTSPTFYDLTDPGGNYQVNNLTPGYYNLTYELNGYGTFRKFTIPVTENNTTILTGTDTLGSLSTTVITNLSATVQSVDSTINISCQVNPLPTVNQPRSFRLFFGSNSNVNPDDYDYVPAQSWLSTTTSGEITGYSLRDLYDSGFAPGQTVYLVAYGDSYYPNIYTEPVSGKKFFPNLNIASPSNITSFILP